MGDAGTYEDRGDLLRGELAAVDVLGAIQPELEPGETLTEAFRRANATRVWALLDAARVVCSDCGRRVPRVAKGPHAGRHKVRGYPYCRAARIWKLIEVELEAA